MSELVTHTSDCAVHNEPALPAAPCNCGATVYECPECHAQQPEAGDCGRCPGTVGSRPKIDFSEIDEKAEHIRTVLRRLDYDDEVRLAGEALGFFTYEATRAAELREERTS